LERLSSYRTTITAVLVALILVGGVLLWLNRPVAAPITVHDEVSPTAVSAGSQVIKVYVSGAVSSPGVYTLQTGDRVEDALRAAGGPGPGADLSRINLAKTLTDEMQVNVPAQGGDGAVSASTEPAQQSGPVNVNTAGAEELDSLPGIGQEYAKRIIQYREENGPFRSIEELKNVPGIGDKRFEQIKSLVSV
jgi:competence protein ComEA